MLGLVLVTESQETQRFITMLIVALLVFAGLLFLITLWYWRHTSPKRRVRRVLQPAGVGPDVDLRRSSYPAADPRLAAQPGYGAQQGGYDPRRDPRSQAYDPRSVDGQAYGQRGYDQRGYDQRGYDQRGYDPRSVDGRGYDPRSVEGRGYDPRYASPAGADPYGRGEPRRRLLQDEEADPYGYGPARRQ